MAPQMCFLGLGHMGKAMSRNLASKTGLTDFLIIWNRTTAVAHAHDAETANTEVAVSAEDAVQKSDIIWSCIGGDDAIKNVIESVVKGDVKGQLFVDCSTTSVQSTKEVADRVPAHGAEFVAMPVFGAPSMAAAGILTCVPAGEAKSAEKVKPYLVGVLGCTVIDFGGEAPEKASLSKLVGNSFIIMIIEAIGEGHVLAEKCGLGTKDLEKFIEAVLPGAYMVHSKNMSSGLYHTSSPISQVSMVKPVADNILGIAESYGTALPGFEVARKNMDVIEDAVWPAGDIDGLYGVIRLLSSLPYANS